MGAFIYYLIYKGLGFGVGNASVKDLGPVYSKEKRLYIVTKGLSVSIVISLLYKDLYAVRVSP